MELTLKMHETTVKIVNENDDLTISELYDYFKSCLIGVSFMPVQIENYIKDEAENLDNE